MKAEFETINLDDVQEVEMFLTSYKTTRGSNMNTNWSKKSEYPSGLPFLPDGGRWDCIINGVTATITRQVPPGRKVVHDHPHEIEFCLWRNGRFVQILNNRMFCMGVLGNYMWDVEQQMGRKSSYPDPEPEYPEFEGPLIELK